MVVRWNQVLLVLLCLVCSSSGTKVAAADAQGQGGRPKLKRSQGKRWDNIADVVRAEIRSATSKFLQGRSQALALPIEVDILLIGFDGDGGYGYTFQKNDLEELLGSATGDNTICPTVWDTKEHAAVCYNVNYMLLDSIKLKDGIARIEQAIKHSFEHVGDRSQDWPDGSRNVQVYEVEASGEVEATLWELLDSAYGTGNSPDGIKKQHHQIIIINPSKRRMRPDPAPLPPPADGSAPLPPPPPPHEDALPLDFIGNWRKGNVSLQHIIDQEAGYLYRYKYNGNGAAASFVGQYNFVVIDVAAGPVSFGPLASASGSVMPAAMPRLMPMLLRMAREIQATPSGPGSSGTLHSYMLESAARGQESLFVGQLASVVTGATRALFASDLRTEHLGHLGAERLLVPIVVIQDHGQYLLDSEKYGINVDEVQLALDEMLPVYQTGIVTVAHHSLHHHPALASALAKARSTRSDAVLQEPPDVGLHKHARSVLDSKMLMRELRQAQDTLLFGMLDGHMNSDYFERDEYNPAPDHLEAHRKGTKVLPVYVLSLERSPDQLMFDTSELVAAGQDMVLVLQLLGQAAGMDNTHGRVYSGHVVEGHQLVVNAAEEPTRHAIAGLAASLSGIVPPYQRFCQMEGVIVEDWRWSVGAQPWGPYSRYSGLSAIFGAAAHRNLLVSRVEGSLRRLKAAMDKVDAFIHKHLQGPFAYLKVQHAAAKRAATLEGSAAAFAQLSPHHYLLDDVARQHMAYHNKTKKAAAKRALRETHDASSDEDHDASDEDHHGDDGGSGDHYEAHHEAEAPVVHHDGSDPSHWDGSQHEETPHDDFPDPEDDHDPHDAELVAQQAALTPNVAGRLQAILLQAGQELEAASLKMFERDWKEADARLAAFATWVDRFVEASDIDLSHAEEVVGCCSVRYERKPLLAVWLSVGLAVVVMGGFGIALAAVMRVRQVHNPHLARARSRSERAMSASGGLPKWSSGGSIGQLPR